MWLMIGVVMVVVGVLLWIFLTHRGGGDDGIAY